MPGVLAVNVHGDEVVLADVAVALSLAGVDQFRVAVQAVERQVQVRLVRANPRLGLVPRLKGTFPPRRKKPAARVAILQQASSSRPSILGGTAQGAMGIVCRVQAAGVGGLGMAAASTAFPTSLATDGWTTVDGVGTTCGPESPTCGGVPLTGVLSPDGVATVPPPGVGATWAEAVKADSNRQKTAERMTTARILL